MAVGLRPSEDFVDPSAMEELLEMPLEEAFEWGLKKNREETKPSSEKAPMLFGRVTFKTEITGLTGTLEDLRSPLLQHSVVAVTKPLGWKALSLAICNLDLEALVKEYDLIHKRVSETVYSDLDERIKESNSYCFINPKVNVETKAIYFPVPVISQISRMSEALGISLAEFTQVLLAETIANNKSGLYSARIKKYYHPEYCQVLDLIPSRKNEFIEVNVILDVRAGLQAGKGTPTVKWL